jgi:integrase/recombinase XerD
MPAISRISMVRDSRCRQLRGRERKSNQTLRSYRRSIETFLRFCDDTGVPRELTKTNVIGWLDAQRDRETATIRLQLTAVKLFARCPRAEEGFNAEGTLLGAIPCQIDGRRSGGGRELDRCARRLD